MNDLSHNGWKDKFTRDFNFWKHQNKIILSLINQIEQATKVMFHKYDEMTCLFADKHMEYQSNYKQRSKLITKLEIILQDLHNKE